jgi:hypothetical protein
MNENDENGPSARVTRAKTAALTTDISVEEGLADQEDNNHRHRTYTSSGRFG